MVGWVALLVWDADRLKFAGVFVFPVLGGLTWRVPVSILVIDGRVAPSGPAADTGNPVKEAAVSTKSQQ